MHEPGVASRQGESQLPGWRWEAAADRQVLQSELPSLLAQGGPPAGGGTGGTGGGTGGGDTIPVITAEPVTLEGNTTGGYSGPIRGVTATDADGDPVTLTNNAPALAQPSHPRRDGAPRTCPRAPHTVPLVGVRNATKSRVRRRWKRRMIARTQGPKGKRGPRCFQHALLPSWSAAAPAGTTM